MLIERERLIAELSAPGHLLIWASPGAGKSTLLRQWVAGALEHGVHAALVDGRSATQLRTALGSRSSIDVLVVDNAESLGRTARTALGELLEVEEMPRIIVAGRWDPFPVSPARWVTTRELRSADLAFTPEELAAFLAVRGVTLEAETAAGLHARIGGWATGAALASHVLAHHDDAELTARDFAGDHRAIGDYLLGEVLGTLDDDERAVLLACSVSGRVSPELATAVTGHTDAGSVLAELARRNLLIEGVHGGDVVYHPVLRAYLVAEARRSSPEATAAAHARASAWFLGRGRAADALQHALASGDAGTMDAVLREHGVELVLRDAAGIPLAIEAVAASSPALAATLRRLAEIPRLMGADEPLAALEPLEAGTPALAAVTSCIVALWEGAPIDLAAGVRGVTGSDAAAGHLETFLRARSALLAATEPREREEAMDAVLAVAETARVAGYRRLAAIATEAAFDAALGTPQWRAVEPLLLDVIRHPLDADTLTEQRAGHLLVFAARLAYLRGDAIPAGVLGVLESPDAAERDPLLYRRARAVVLLHALDGAPSREALQRLDSFVMEGAADPAFLSFVLVPWLAAALQLDSHPMVTAVRYRVEHAFGGESLEHALVTFVAAPCRDTELALRTAIELDAPSSDPMTLAHAHVRLAVHAAAHGASAKMLADLTEGVMIAAHFHAVRPFLLFGGDAVALLADNADHLGAWRDEALELLARCRAVAGVSARAVSVPLSQRERALLDELPVHQTIADIARRHQVSPNTIKSQLKSMYRKLGVESRAEAVEAGRRTGLLG